MKLELLNITFSVPVYYTEEELDTIEEELKDVEDVVNVVCNSQTWLDEVTDDDYIELKETLIVFSVKTDNYKHIIGRLEIAIKECLNRI